MPATPRDPALPTPLDPAAEARARDLSDRLFDAEARATAESPPRRPGSTYRLQVHRGFTLDDATKVVDYLADLGVTDGYLSPYLAARPGSTHGYDVFDHRKINAEIGDRIAHERLLARLADHGMGRVLDIVPNHMGVAGLNPFWVDVLELGRQSDYAHYFDIDWTPAESLAEGRLLLPILGDQYGKELESGNLLLKFAAGRFFVAYHDRELPIAPRSYALILAGSDRNPLAIEDAEALREIRSIAASAESLPAPSLDDDASRERVATEREVIRGRLARLVESCPEAAGWIERRVAEYRGEDGGPGAFDSLHALLEAQVYRLAYWRVASEEINYRRFFDINDLAGLRTEDPRVFNDTHSRIFDWISEGGVTALRIDHPDGLADPAGYFDRLQQCLFLRACRDRYREDGAANEVPWRDVRRQLRRRFRDHARREPASALARRFPVLVEKILTGDEPIPGDWTIDGTVGYEFLNAVNGLFVDPAAKESILATYGDFTGEPTTLGPVLFEAKRLVTRSSLASERNALAHRLARIASADRRSRDFTRAELGRALGAIMATFPVYRTYLKPGRPTSKRDRRVIERAVTKARSVSPTIDASVFAFVEAVLLRDHPEGLPAEQVALREAFVTRFQQTTGPVQAKGLEDTSFYRYVPLLSLNEVGGDPSRFGTSPEAFHDRNTRRGVRWPGGLLATATHDTKRGEDARIRIDALSERPDAWAQAVERWAELNAPHKRSTPRGPAPDAREEYFLYQTLIGAWPFRIGPGDVTEEFVGRIQAYMVKAAREAKVKTSWTDADPSHVQALEAFVAAILTGPESSEFVADLAEFAGRIARIGVVHSLAQTLIKLTSPGVPDVYQGTELWDLSLVDPDNRRPVDFAHRAERLAAIRGRIEGGEPRAQVMASLLDAPDDGAIKLALIATALRHRRDNLRYDRPGGYLPLTIEGEHADRAIAFARIAEDGSAAITVAPRLVAPLMGDDADRPPIGEAWGSTRVVLPTELAERAWSNVLTDEATGGELWLREVFRTLPVALLVGDGTGK